MRRKNLDAAPCPIARSLDVIGDWWSLLIVRDAFLGRSRFGEFQKSLGLSKNILTQRLRALAGDGILEQVPASDGGAHQEYVLTSKGRGLFPVLVALRQWGTAQCFDAGACPTVLVDRDQGLPVRPLELRSADGRLLNDADTRLQNSLVRE
ncbi:MAG TPA: helix-turn-helix domain-containing protein [Aliidongia sp.]|uniref:winged helix-turn-helix transcriptional regulator n=1 Tax=Aliidongia sp. TaxID=1914230 RepID=UPI002DDD4B2A|nr:helix-turn-helix domain-containing protein [Aliidongia sp.]HEV2678739.1 helix-turn-helix domain-containing protein [Aliidongia sp.]